MIASHASLTDTHCHIMLPVYDKDRAEVLARARSSAVSHLLVPGLDLSTSQIAVKIAEEFPWIYASVGVHPHNAKTWDHNAAHELRKLARSPSVVAIGEIGLDFYRNLSSRESQENAFQAQLDLANELELPVVIHNRNATKKVMSHLIPWSQDLPSKLADRAGVLHAYSADYAVAVEAIDAGFFLGVAGPITYPNAESRRRITSRLPIERLLLETDAPYLTPHPNQKKRNEPALIHLIADQLAELMKTSTTVTIRTTSKNASKLFSWDHETQHSDVL
jgi:TatD DNase family protein